MRIAYVKFCHLHTASCLRIGDLILGRIDRYNNGRGTAINNFLGEGAVAAANVEPSETSRYGEPVEEYIANQTAPAA
ncbi:MAG: hypothetical protein WCC42_30425, partial [Pseudolabrys sp.]